MTKEELKEHCERQIECCEMWARQCGEKPHGKIYEEYKLILDLINALEQQENKGTVALIEPSQKTTLRQLMQPSDDCVSLEVYKQVIHERDIAIEQLKELGYELGEKIETSNDCVSREQALLSLTGENLSSMNAEELIVLFNKRIKALPPVTPTHNWIPVSERLPKEDGEYLLFGKIDEDEENYIFIGEYDSCGEQFGIWQEQFDRTTLGCLGSEFFEYSSVIAWQPLPKPCEEKRGEVIEND